MPGLPVSPKHYYKYVADNGITYRRKVSDYIATQVDGAAASIIGAVLAAGTEPKWPGKYKPRRAVVRDLTANLDRVVEIMTPTAPMITVPTPAGAGTINLNRGVNASFAYTYQGLLLTEEFRR